MAKCAICEKAAHFGNSVSHSHRRANKMWKANVKSVKVKVNGGTQRMYVCMKAIIEASVKGGAIYLPIEQDQTYGLDPFDCIRTSVKNIRDMGFGEYL